jgi:hypothetical protein
VADQEAVSGAERSRRRTSRLLVKEVSTMVDTVADTEDVVVVVVEGVSEVEEAMVVRTVEDTEVVEILKQLSNNRHYE